METLTAQNELAVNNMPENDEDFIEYDLDVKNHFQFSTIGKGDITFTKDNLLLENKGGDEFMLKVWPKKSFLIGALKFGFKQAEGTKAREEGDDASMEVNVWLNWNNSKICQRVATVKIDELADKETSMEDLDKKVKLQRTDGNRLYCGEAFFLQFKVKGEKGKDHFRKFSMDMLKFYM